MATIETLYTQLTLLQQEYFDLTHQIGYGAIPIQVDSTGKSDPFELARTRGGKPIGEFPDISNIAREIEDAWGKRSVPMRYFKAVFAERPTYDIQTQPLSGTQANW